MAVIQRGILGGFSNKIGNVVGSSWKGIATMRSLPLSVANPNTSAQQAVRGQFSSASKAASTLLSTIVKPMWDRFAQQQSGYNAFIQANINNFDTDGFTGESTFAISRGALAVSNTLTAIADISGDDVTLTWNPTPAGDANPSDEAYVVTITERGADTFFEGYVTTIARSAGTCVVEPSVGVVSGDVVYTYLAFRKTDGTKVSDTSYLQATVQA